MQCSSTGDCDNNHIIYIYIYINIFNIYKSNIFFTNIYMHVCVFIYT